MSTFSGMMVKEKPAATRRADEGGVELMPAAADLFEAGELVALVDPVDCTGAQGKGIAEMFALRHRDACDAYRAYARSRAMKPGAIWFTRSGARWIIFAATKNHFSRPSLLAWVQVCVDNLVREVVQRGIREVAIPALGCGEGGLFWTDVFPILRDGAGRMADAGVKVKIYPPRSRPPQRPRGGRR